MTSVQTQCESCSCANPSVQMDGDLLCLSCASIRISRGLAPKIRVTAVHIAEAKVLRAMRDNPGASWPLLRKLCSLPAVAVDAALQRLIETDTVERAPGKPGMYWVTGRNAGTPLTV